jgi:ADP-ribosyl-[dinitrogen reductase] hydrolase
MLVELAVGDAYGAGFEYTGQAPPADPTDMRYVQHPRHRGTRPGMYTDDTQMSLAIAELLVEGRKWTPENIAGKFVEVFHRDPREGYAGGFHAFLQKTRSATEFLGNIRPHSDKSGAAMRAGPLGVLPSVGQVLDRCRVQAALTHNTPDGIHSAQAAALMTHYFLYGLGPGARLGAFLAGQVPGQWDVPWLGKVKSKGWMSVRAAVTAVGRNDSLAGLLRDCVAFTGDVDTVATIALAAASCSDEYARDLPAGLIEGLENGPYGRDYLARLDEKLLSLAGR